MSKRPEHQAPPDIYYNDVEAEKYTKNSRIIEIQTKMTERAVEILQLPEDESCLLLDIGCGSGLSGEYLSEIGHSWIGLDISQSMLNVAVDREVEGDLFLSDAGQGMFFRPGTFDGVISISAIQWLCNADKTSHHPVKRLYKFFSTLYASMRRGTKAVFQLYPESPDQLELITQQATKAGFGGGVVVDFPNSTKAKKIFLCLFCGLPASTTVPKGLGAENSNQINNTSKRMRYSDMKGKNLKKSRDWIIEKKERRQRQGKTARPTTKYTGRKRKTKF